MILIVYIVGKVAIKIWKALNPNKMLPDNRKTPPLAKIGKSVDVIIVVLVINHNVTLVSSFDLIIKLVRASSISKPFCASVTGPWSSRGMLF